MLKHETKSPKIFDNIFSIEGFTKYENIYEYMLSYELKIVFFQVWSKA